MQVVDVRAAAAGTWIKEAFALFRALPLAWISLMSCWLLLSAVIFLFVPLIGPAVATMMQPGLFAGFVLAARDQSEGRGVTISHLFAGFRFNGRALVTVGSITLLAEILLVAILGLLGLPHTIPVESSSGMPDMQAYAKLLDGKEWLVLIGFGLMMLLKAVLWFSAALLALHAMPVSHAIRWSFYAVIANFVPLVLFGLMMMLLCILAALPWLLGMLVWMPVYALTHYTSYRQVFREG